MLPHIWDLRILSPNVHISDWSVLLEQKQQYFKITFQFESVASALRPLFWLSGFLISTVCVRKRHSVGQCPCESTSMSKQYNLMGVLNIAYSIHRGCFIILCLFSYLLFWAATFSMGAFTFQFPLNERRVKLLLSFLVAETLAKIQPNEIIF